LPERRAAVLKQFDADGDTRLNQAERETARRAWAAERLAQRGDRGFFGPPPEILQEFDANKDGELDEKEGRVAGETMERRFTQMRKDYDKDANGELDPEEIAAASRDVDSGKLKGIPKMFLQFAAAGPRRGGPRQRQRGVEVAITELEPAEILRRADVDQDHRLSPAELATARAEFAKRRAAKARENPEAAHPPTR
jgi:hypothetical protein